jgi:hypothetical protein
MASRYKLSAFKDAVLTDKSHFRGLAIDFLESALSDIRSFKIAPAEGEFIDDAVLATIKEMLPLRDTVVEFLDLVFKYKNDQDLYDLIPDWFESLVTLKAPFAQSIQSGGDHRAFFTHETFLYYAALLIKHKRYAEFGKVTDRIYYVPGSQGSPQKDIQSFQCFRSYPASLEEQRKSRLKLNRLSLTADLLKERVTLTAIGFDQLMQADGVLLLKSIIASDSGWSWYPVSCIYAGYSSVFDLFNRARSTREFGPLQKMFGVSSAQELVLKWDEAAAKHKVMTWSDFAFHSHVNFRELFNLDHLCERP